MATEQALRSVSYPANADLSAKQYFFVNINSSGKIVVAGDGARAIGVLQDKPAAADRAGAVAIFGQTKISLGGTVAVGDAVASDSAGEAVVAATGDAVLGTCIQGGADGEIGSILFNPSNSGI